MRIIFNFLINRFARFIFLIILFFGVCHCFDAVNAKGFGIGSKVIYLLPGVSVQGSLFDNFVAEAALWAYPAQGVPLGNNIYHGRLLYTPEKIEDSALYGISFWQFITNSIEDNGTSYRTVRPGFITISYGRRWQNDKFAWAAALDVGSVFYLTFSLYFLV